MRSPLFPTKHALKARIARRFAVLDTPKEGRERFIHPAQHLLPDLAVDVQVGRKRGLELGQFCGLPGGAEAGVTQLKRGRGVLPGHCCTGPGLGAAARAAFALAAWSESAGSGRLDAFAARAAFRCSCWASGSSAQISSLFTDRF